MFSSVSLLCTVAVALLCVLAADRRLGARIGRMGGPLDVSLPAWGEGRRALAVVMFVALGLRLWRILRTQGAVLPEEMQTVLEARSLWRTGKNTQGLACTAFFPGLDGTPVGPLLAWMVLPLVPWVGDAVWVARLPMAALQLLSMLALWDLVRRAFSQRAARWSLFILAVSPWQLMQCGWPLSWQTYSHVLLLGVWMCSRGLRRPLWCLGGALMFALSLYSCDTAVYVTPVVILVLLPWLARSRRRGLLWGGLSFALVVGLGLPAFGQAVDFSARWLWRTQVPVGEAYAGYADMPAITQYGPQVLPLFRNDAAFASVFANLCQSLIRLLNGSVLQYAPDAEETASFFVRRYGFLYLFSLPLTLLGGLRLVVRGVSRLQARGRARGNAQPGAPLRGMLLALCLGPLPFLLLHTGLEMRHYGVLFYPLVLLTAAGAVYVARRVRFSGLLLALIYGLGLFTFCLRGYPLDPGSPGVTQALRAAADGPARQAVVTSAVYPFAQAGAAVESYVRWAWDIPPGESPEQRRVAVTGETPDASVFDGQTVVVLHASQMEGLPPESYQAQWFDGYAVLWPRDLH